MAASQPARRPAVRNPLEFFSDAGNRVDQFRRQAEAAGRVIYEASIKAGTPIVANTTAQLAELGAKAMRKEQAAAQAVATVAKNPRPPQAQRILHEAGAHVMAGVHGAGDAISLGAADHVSAGIRAAIDSGGDLHSVRGLYDRNIAQEHQQDEFEGEHYGKARMIGEIGGTVASMLVPVGEVAQAARLAAGARALAGARLAGVGSKLAPVTARAIEIARPMATRTAKLVEEALGPLPKRMVKLEGGGEVEATRMIPLEHVAMGGAGAASNVAAQAFGDLTTGHRSSVRDYLVAAGVGAAQGGFAHRLGPGSLGAIGGAATSAGQDLADDRRISLLNAAVSAGVGGAGGRFAGGRVEKWSSKLPPSAERGGLLPSSKGELGEWMMVPRTIARGGRPRGGPYKIPLPSGRKTVPDGYFSGLFDNEFNIAEAKFMGGELTVPQQQARALYGNNYRLDKFLPRDVGVAAGLPASNFASTELRDLVDRATGRPGVDYWWLK